MAAQSSQEDVEEQRKRTGSDRVVDAAEYTSFKESVKNLWRFGRKNNGKGKQKKKAHKKRRRKVLVKKSVKRRRRRSKQTVSAVSQEPLCGGDVEFVNEPNGAANGNFLKSSRSFTRSQESLPSESEVTNTRALQDTLLRLEGNFDAGELSLLNSVSNEAVADKSTEHGTVRISKFHERTERLVEKPLKWKRRHMLGVGAFGKVYLGEDERTGSLVAVKEIDMPSGKNMNRAIKAVENEINVIRSLHHSNVVRYLGVGRSMEGTTLSLHVFMEYVEGGSLHSLIQLKGKMDEGSTVRPFSYQLLYGLNFLHYQRIIHRDIKPSNVLLCPEPLAGSPWTLKIADFGASKSIGDMVNQACEGFTTLTGTPHYMAPEVVLQSGTSRKADIWSFGCTVVEMLSGVRPWSSMMPMQVMLHLGTTEDCTPPIPDVSDDCLDFLTQCFVHDPRDRANARSLYEHPWLTSVDRPSSDDGFCLRPRAMGSSDSDDEDQNYQEVSYYSG